MIAARTADASWLSRMIRKIGSKDLLALDSNSNPFDVAFAVSVDVERRHLVIALDVGQGLDGGAETADPCAGQVANGKSLLQSRSGSS